MLFHGDNYRTNGDPGMPSRAWMTNSYRHWNLWMTRRLPYQDLVDGSRITLVDSWTDGGQTLGRLTWEVEAVNVLKMEYSTKAQAIRAIAAQMNETVSYVKGNRYTMNGPVRGYLLAWQVKPVRRLDLPRPPDMKLGRHGWLRENDPARLTAWGLRPSGLAVRTPQVQTTHTRQGQGHGRRLTPAENRAVEDAEL
jgi:hypothetical protein